MKIIRSNPNESGAYPPMQEWKGAPPDHYYSVHDSVDTSVFYEYNGFVSIESDGRTVTEMSPNTEAWEKWKASLPEPEEPAPTAEEQMRADIDYIAAMTGVDLT